MLSVVIPTLNASGTLGPCLAAVHDADEILVVDGGSSDGTVAIAECSGVSVVKSPRGRGVQLHSGALAARGDWLLCLHADTLLAPGWREAVDLHIASRGNTAAHFRFRLDAEGLRARLVETGVALRVSLLAMPYGDQGLLISRRHYEEIGGFRPLPLMEDVEIVARIGRSRLRRLDVAAITSAERWRKDGWIRRSARNLGCLILYKSGVEPDRLAEFYSRPSGGNAREQRKSDAPQTKQDEQCSHPERETI